MKKKREKKKNKEKEKKWNKIRTASSGVMRVYVVSFLEAHPKNEWSKEHVEF